MPKNKGRAFDKISGEPYTPFFGGGVAEPMSAPINVKTLLLTSTSGRLSWEPPVFLGGQTITGYRVGRDGQDSGGTGPWSTVVGPAVRSATFQGLLPTNYTLTVRAVSAQGDGPFSGAELFMGGAA